jgi:hypothetical protein
VKVLTGSQWECGAEEIKNCIWDRASHCMSVLLWNLDTPMEVRQAPQFFHMTQEIITVYYPVRNTAANSHTKIFQNK